MFPYHDGDMGFSALNYVSEPSRPLDAGGFLEAIPYSIEYAFQPIVNINTGVVYGFEALLRGQERMGLSTIQSFFDHAWQLGTGQEIVFQPSTALVPVSGAVT